MSECLWPGKNQIMKRYHDKEWCVPSHDDLYIFEMLILEGAQAGLSWSTILAKREEYKKAFHNFDIDYCSKLTDEDLDNIREKYNVIKNLSKIKAVRSNAIAVIELQKEFGSLSNFLWKYVEDRPIINSFETEGQMPAQTELSEKISKDLKKRGFKFVGPVIIYSFMQAIGLVDDHIITCPYHSLNR
ncbi:DNA-3-methyladenine glycosylase I [Clostridium sp. 19966]|uniref:DNA-3-methyladenine glycosylase I n=1 Tax=Clostridium sp. 19966 TaxID=2768166 RepID=UPI0028DDCA9F|nr:DNA-3-methyladenine glycosylase I [Clostridium sp. 19966]MDT8719234.1 DNA-3-methyladenine glycosylase I [Clostridium sp. 19966]